MEIKKTILTLASIALVVACLPIAVQGADGGERSAVSEDELLMSFVEEVMSTESDAWDDPRPYDALSASDALRRDAEWYAAEYGVALDEAIRRLELQNPLGELNAKLSANERGTFAGLWIQHTPDYRIVARFTRDGTRTIQPYLENGPLAGLVEVRDARWTLAELQSAQDQAMRLIRAQGIEAESGIDSSENRVDLYVTDPTHLHAVLQNARPGLPDSVEIIHVQELSTPVTDIYGGLSLGYCTAGYPVRAVSDGTLGVTTASHCPNDESYEGVALTFMEELYNPAHDIQWHTSSQLTVRPSFQAGSETRYVGLPKRRLDQLQGETVCKNGKMTGYGCGSISKTNYYINGSSTYVLVSSTDGTDLAERGDSGGPWFSGNRPYGTSVQQIDKSAVYMPIEYVAELGVDVYVDWCRVYDTNGQPGIQKDEALKAVDDYYAELIPEWGAAAVLICYFG